MSLLLKKSIAGIYIGGIFANSLRHSYEFYLKEEKGIDKSLNVGMGFVIGLYPSIFWPIEATCFIIKKIRND